MIIKYLSKKIFLINKKLSSAVIEKYYFKLADF